MHVLDRPDPAPAAVAPAQGGVEHGHGLAQRHGHGGRSLRVYLTGLLIGVLLPPVLLAVYLGASTVAEERRDLEQELQRVAEEVALDVDELARQRQHELAQLARLVPLTPSGQSGPSAQSGASAQAESPVQSPAALLATDAQGHSVLGARVADFAREHAAALVLVQAGAELPLTEAMPAGAAAARALPAAAAATVAWVQRHGVPAYGDGVEAVGGSARWVLLAVPVLSGARVDGVLAALQDAHDFARLLAHKRVPSGWELLLRDARGQVIASTAVPPSAVDAGLSFSAAAAVTGWRVHAQAGTRAGAMPLWRVATELGALLLLGLLATAVGAALGARRLGRAVDALAEGVAPPPHAARIRELESARAYLEAWRREQERALRAAISASQTLNQTLNQTLACMSDGFFAIDRGWRFTLVNPAAAHMLGHVDGATLLGRSARELLPGLYDQAPFTAAQRALDSGVPELLEVFDARRKRWLELRMFPSAQGLSVYVSDVSGRRQADEAVRSAAQRYRLLFVANPTPMWVCDLQTLRFLDVNDKAMQNYGYSREEFLAMTVADIRPREDVARMQTDIDKARADAQAPVFGAGLYRHRVKDGRVIDVEVTRAAVSFEGRDAGLVAAVDVTARLAAEHARETALARVRSSEQRYRELFELSPHPTFVREQDTRQLLAVNDAALRAYGYSREEMLALRLDDLIPAPDQELLQADLVRHGLEPLASESPGWIRRHQRKDGSAFEVELTSRAIEFEGRSARLVVATVLTERLRAQAERDEALLALRARVERLRVFVAQAPVSLAMFDRGMHYIAASRHWHRNFGLGEADLTGRHHHEVMPDMKPEWKLVEQRGLAGETIRAEADRLQHADGRVQWLRWEVLPWTEPATGAVGGILIFSEDITQRVADEQALRTAEAYQRGLFEAMGDGVLLLDAGLEVLDANPRALLMLGLERDALLGQRLPSLVHASDPLQVSQTLADLLAATDGRARLAVWEQQRRDGSRFPAEVSACRADAGRIVVVLRDISERRAVQRALIAHQLELSDLAQRLLAQERETTRHVAQTLHDQLGQELTVARLRLDTALVRASHEMPPALLDTCVQVGAALDHAMADVRLVLGELRPPMLEEQGLLAALDNEIRRRTLDGDSVDVLLEVDEAELANRWPGDVEYAAFMIAREAIVNAQQHADATLVRVIVEGDAAQLRLEVIDDGRGIDPAVRAGRPGHLGLVGMRERALAIGARFAVEALAPADAVVGGGTRVLLHWPTEQAGRAAGTAGGV